MIYEGFRGPLIVPLVRWEARASRAVVEIPFRKRLMSCKKSSRLLCRIEDYYLGLFIQWCLGHVAGNCWVCGRGFGLCLKQRVCVFRAFIYVYGDQVLDIEILLRYMYIFKAIPNYPNQQYICVCIITTSIAHWIKNPPRITKTYKIDNLWM